MNKLGIVTNNNNEATTRAGDGPMGALRAMLLGSVALGAIVVATSDTALAACDASTGVTVFCSTTADNDPGQKVLGNGQDASSATSGATAGSNITGSVTVPVIETSGAGSEGLRIESNGGNGFTPGTVISGAGDPGTDGANGGKITFSNGAEIKTEGAGSHGISAQSVGGDGGNGGDGADSQGAGGDGGNGAAINLTNTGAITVLGGGSNGIQATSKGGAGGTGSTAGANGDGDGGKVTITNSGDINSAKADGINAQSTGVKSGAVKITNSAEITTAGGTGIKAESNGAGGTVEVENTVLGSIKSLINGIFGSADGNVTVTNSGSVTTEGDLGDEPPVGAGDAISVRSATGLASVVNEATSGKVESFIGNGIVAVSLADEYSDDTGARVRNRGDVYAELDGIVVKSEASPVNAFSSGAIDAGGSGIVAESAMGPVTVTNEGTIAALVDGINAQITNENASEDVDVSVANDGSIGTEDAPVEGRGIVASNKGSGGVTVSGTGSVTSVDVGISADATTGKVDVTAGAVTTKGESSNGIDAKTAAAQGAPGDAATLGTAGQGQSATSGGAGASAGEVKVTANGAIDATGKGIAANSTGGAGGKGGDDSENDVGAVGGAGGNGGIVSVTANAAVTATGTAIQASSTGGSGGNGGSGTDSDGVGGKGGNGDDVKVATAITATIKSQTGAGIEANSTGGSGGTGSTAGDGGNGGIVGVTHAGKIDAKGDGINAASTGGGSDATGGNGGDGGTVNVAANGAIVSGRTGIQASSSGWTGRNGDGDGVGGNGGNGGSVTVKTAAGADVKSTAGDGIRASSVGGSGGTGGTGGDNGKGGDVTVETKGNVDAKNSGIVALSGNSYPDQGALSDGGKVTVVSKGNVKSGQQGIFAQTTADVNVTNSGSVSSTSAEHYAIEANATGADSTATVINSGKVTGAGSGIGASAENVLIRSSKDVSGGTYYGINAIASGESFVDITGGTVTGKDAAINFEGGGSHELWNDGKIVAAAGGLALKGQGDVSVENNGTVTGNIDLASSVGGVSQFDNLSGGVLNSGSDIKLQNGPIVTDGPNGTLTNSGVMSPGGNGTVQKTTITGNFKQEASGTLVVDADWNTGISDRLNVTGTAVLDGTVQSNTMNLLGGQGGLTKSFTVITAGDGATLKSTAVSPSDTAAVDYTLLQTNEKTIKLDARVNFLGVQQGGIVGLTPNQGSVGGALNSIIAAGGTTGQNLAFLPTMLSETTPANLAVALQQLAPQGEASQVGQVVATAGNFAQQLRSCRVNGDASDIARFIREGQCVWARIGGRHFDNDGDGNSAAFSERGTFVSGGVQVALGDNWMIGGGAGYEQVDASSAASKADTDRYHFGGVLKYNPGPWLLTAGLSGGFGSSDSVRSIKVGALSSVANGSYDSDYISGRVTGAYLINLGGSLYAKPEAEVAVTNYKRDAYVESATGGTALAVAGADETVVSVSTGVEIGSEMSLGAGGGVLRPFVRGGVTWFDSDSFSTVASFADAGPGSSGFSITSTTDDVVADIAAGLDLIAPGGTALRLQYDGRFGEQTEQHGGTAKVSVPF